MDPYLIIHFSYDILCYSINHSQYILIVWPRIYSLFPCQFACHFFRYPTLGRGLEVVLLLFQLQHRRLTCRLWLFNRWFSHENQMIFPWKPSFIKGKLQITTHRGFKKAAPSPGRNASFWHRRCHVRGRQGGLGQALVPEKSSESQTSQHEKIRRVSVSQIFTDVHRFSASWLIFSPSKVSLMCP